MLERVTISIRAIMIIGFGCLSITGIALALYLGLSAAFQNTRELLSENAETLVLRMVHEIDSRLEPVEIQARWFTDRVADGRVSIDRLDQPDLTRAIDAMLAATPQVAGVAVLSADHVARQWNRDHGPLGAEDWSHRPAITAWLEAGRERSTPQWGPPFWLESLDTAVIIYESPLFRDDVFLGFLALAVPISDLSLHLAQVSETSFILAGKENVLAHRSLIDWRPLDEEQVPSAGSIYEGVSALVPLEEVNDLVLEHVWSAEYQELAMLQAMEEVNATASVIGDREFIFLYKTVAEYGPVPWFVGTYLDVDKEGEAVRRLIWALVAGGVVIVVTFVLGAFTATAIGRPVRALAQASEAVNAGRFDDVPELPKSRIREFDNATRSFRGMVAGLAERDVIRRTLGRYVPESIAEKLLAEDGSLAPTEATATILFADVAGFTALTQELGPVRIVEVLNAYFSRMTAIIEAHSGVITQFQGDAILAIFNVPIEAADHAAAACRAAVDMRAAVAAERFAGQKLEARIGVNTGPVVAGAVGAEGRLTYTVHGDAVNRAARVEAMNKDTGTTVLVTQATVSVAGDMPFIEVGTLDVRGQSEPVTVYTIKDGGGDLA